MFLNKSVQDVMTDKIYSFPYRTSYKDNWYKGWHLTKSEDPQYLIKWNIRKELFDSSFNQGKLETAYDFWWMMNEDYQSYFEPNPELPLCWLAQAKWALYIDFVPSNFYLWALPILEWFDLERWILSYNPIKEEYTALRNDLPIVITGLRNYPTYKLAAPIDELSWGIET